MFRKANPLDLSPQRLRGSDVRVSRVTARVESSDSITIFGAFVQTRVRERRRAGRDLGDLNEASAVFSFIAAFDPEPVLVVRIVRPIKSYLRRGVRRSGQP